MQVKPNHGSLGVALAVALTGFACNRSSVREAPITGKPSDPSVTMQAAWPVGKRCIYRVETITSSDVPRKNTRNIIHAEFTLGQDLAFSVTNAAPDGSREVQMEILSVQMETARDDGVTLSFDSDNKVMQVDENELINRLKRLIGLKLTFQVSPDNKVTRMDGTKEFNNRAPGPGGSLRGVAASALNRQVNPAFYKDIVEMGMLPKNPVKVGETWTVSRQGGPGLWGVNGAVEINYKFSGWQRREGTNCARVDFSGTIKPSTRTNQSILRGIAAAAAPPKTPSTEEGTINGQSWFDPGLALAVETICDQSFTTKSSTTRTTRVKVDTNNVAAPQIEPLTNAPPPQNSPPGTNVVTTTTTKSRQHTTVKLLNVLPLEK
jgi:hypothetical protein